jgi:radical SAM protein, TIGR01212 family
MTKGKTQRETNPFPFTDSNKRYHTFDYHMKQKYGGKCAKIPLDAAFSCPNIDGTKGFGGCIYCSGGSADRNIVCAAIENQYAHMREVMAKKWSVARCIPYLQANTNTYGKSLEQLREIYERAAKLPNAVALYIGTRGDCVTDEIANLIADVSESCAIPVTVELGLQTVHDSTAAKINRCHTYADFLRGYELLKNRSRGDVSVCVHIINGLPGESAEMMQQTARTVAALEPDQVKIHLLHVLKKTKMADIYASGEYQPMEMDAYFDTVCNQIEVLPPQTVIARLTGDGVRDELIAPAWSLRKTAVLNEIDKELMRRGTYQGCAR